MFFRSAWTLTKISLFLSFPVFMLFLPLFILYLMSSLCSFFMFSFSLFFILPRSWTFINFWITWTSFYWIFLQTLPKFLFLLFWSRKYIMKLNCCIRNLFNLCFLFLFLFFFILLAILLLCSFLFIWHQSFSYYSIMNFV